jgi:hypothetical protein
MNSKNALFAIVLFLLLTLLARAQDASPANKGMTKLSVPATNSYDPVAAGDNDPRLNVYRNVSALGAIGDGTTDNSAYLQNAINSGHAVMIPEGVFNFGTTLTLKKDSIIVGVGKKSVLRYTGNGVAMREPVGSYVNGYDNLKLMNFTLTTSSNSATGIELTNNYQVTMSGLFIDGGLLGFRTAGIHIIGGSAATNSAIIRITDGEIWFCTGDGILISGPAGGAGVWIERNHISGNVWGINQTVPDGKYPATNFQIKNNVIEGNLQGAIQAQVLYASSITGNYFENIDNFSNPIIKIATNGYAQGLNISDNLFGGKKSQFNIDMNGPADVTGVIANNTFAGASVAAIRANTARGLVIQNNTLETGTVPTVVSLGAASRSVWIQDYNNASYVSGGSQVQPNLTIGGRVIVGGGASLKNNAGTLETRTSDGNGYAPLTALYFKQSAGPTWTSGATTPAGSCVTGSLFTRTNGGPKTTLYVCEGGAWTAK